jgi:hypothetical protein
MRRTLLLPALLLSVPLASCAYTVTTPPARCAELIPRKWAEGVAGAPLPTFTTLDQIADPKLRAELETREWQKAFVGQSVQLEIANGRTADVIYLFGNCEKLQNEARAKSEKHWWQFWR